MRWSLTIALSLAAATGNLAAVRASVSAMACCAKTHGHCAGVSAPDDCCQRMGHGVASASAIPPSGQSAPVALPLAVLPVVRPVTNLASAAPLVVVSFKRLHDPPHLHPIALLI